VICFHTIRNWQKSYARNILFQKFIIFLQKELMKTIQLTANGKTIEAQISESDFNEVFEELIDVPESIHIILNDSHINFNNDKQGLRYCFVGEYDVLSRPKVLWEHDLNLKLKECDWDELDPKDIFLYCDQINPEEVFDKIQFYGIKLDKGSYVCVLDKELGVTKCSLNWNHYYKVIQG